jgi:hypothetical protein
MSPADLLEHTHVYSMFSFRNGQKESGIIVNKYNLAENTVEYFFISHADMNTYKKAFEKYDTATCNTLLHKINADDILRIDAVSVGDYISLMAQPVADENINAAY